MADKSEGIISIQNEILAWERIGYLVAYALRKYPTTLE
jgi:hypothetical protein